jgi:hypothetical protein
MQPVERICEDDEPVCELSSDNAKSYSACPNCAANAHRAARAFALYAARHYVCDEHIKGRLSDEMIAITAIARQFLRRTTWQLLQAACAKKKMKQCGFVAAASRFHREMCARKQFQQCTEWGFSPQLWAGSKSFLPPEQHLAASVNTMTDAGHRICLSLS